MSTPGKPTWQETHPRFSPCLGAGIKKDMTIDEFFGHVLYPVIASPKYDGIRCTTLADWRHQSHQSRPVCRSLDNDIPNKSIFESIAMSCPPGLDGEILTYASQQDLLNPVVMDTPRPFYAVQSDVMSEQGQPRFQFHIFDYHPFNEKYPHLIPYNERIRRLLEDIYPKLPAWCKVAPFEMIENRIQLEEYERKMVEENSYEGICWRHYLAPYKYGRSTLRQQILIKMKRFLDDEAEVVDTYEEMHNANLPVTNALGYKERSSHSQNMIGKERLGGLVLKCKKFELEFNCGSGFNADERERLWKIRDQIKGLLVKFKHQPHGGKDRPRIPVFLGFRDLRDM